MRTGRARLFGLTLAALLLVVARLAAHHEILAKFDDHKPVTLNGIVTLVDWRNPHVHVFMNVADAKGVVNWAIELEGPIDLQRSGWSRDSLRPGDKIHVEGIAARNGSHQAWGNSVVMQATGKNVYAMTLTAPAPSLEQRPTPRWPDRQPRLGASQGGSQGYWAYPSVTALAEGNSADKIAIPMDTSSLRNIADAPKVAPMQPWALRSIRNARRDFFRMIRYLNCKPPGGPRQFQLAHGVQFVEDRIARDLRADGSGNNNYRIINTMGATPARSAATDDNSALLRPGRGNGKATRWWSIPGGFNEDFWFTNGDSPTLTSCDCWNASHAPTSHVERRCDHRRRGRLYQAMVKQLHASLGGRRRNAPAPVPGQPVLT